MKEAERHYHGWILRIDSHQAVFESMPGEYSTTLKCRRHTIKKAGGDAQKVIVLVCRGGETCPSKIEVEAITT